VTTAGTPGMVGSSAAGRGVGTGMMGAPARGAGGGDDLEHNTPSYLITQEHGSEIVGALPLVAPPVIGE